MIENTARTNSVGTGGTRAYAGSATPQQVASFIRAAPSLVVLTHAKPDGDALGSVLTVVRAAQSVGVRAEGWLVGPVPHWTDHFALQTPVRKLSTLAEVPPDEPDAVVIVDTGSFSQLAPLDAWVRTRHAKAAIVDHHLHGDASAADVRLVTTHSASCTEALAPVIDALLGLAGNAPIPREIAAPMYLGLATDTGWLRYSNTTPATLRLAARLIESGVDHAGVYEVVEQQAKPVRPVLLGLALSSLVMHHVGEFGFMTITDEQLRKLGAVGEDTGGFAEPVLAVRGVRVVSTFTQMPTQPSGRDLTKVSIRSKPGPHAIDVAAVAATLGGGGHARAAGIKLELPVDQAQSAVLAALLRAVEQVPAPGPAPAQSAFGS